MAKRIVIGVVALLILLGVGGGAFYGGMQYQLSLATNVQARFFADRSGAPGGGAFTGGPAGGGAFIGGTPPAGFQPGAGGFPGGRGTQGDIKAIDGGVLTLSTAEAEVKVTLTDSTQIQQLVNAETGALQVGQRITVRGEADASGNLTAAAIQITNSAQP